VKKNVFFVKILITVLCYSTLINAQSKFSIGPVIGVNYTSFTARNTEKNKLFDTKEGLYAGIFLDYKLSGPFSLQPEIVYTMKGSVASLDYYPGITCFENYIEVPVLIKYSLKTESTSLENINIYAGPAFAFDVFSNTDVDEANTLHLIDIRKFDLGLALGGGIGFKAGRGILGFSLRYTAGLLSINYPGINDVYNKTITFMSNYSFQL
jgi:hypothetical protein